MYVPTMGSATDAANSCFGSVMMPKISDTITVSTKLGVIIVNSLVGTK